MLIVKEAERLIAKFLPLKVYSNINGEECCVLFSEQSSNIHVQY